MAEASVHSRLRQYLLSNQGHYFDVLRQMVGVNSFTANAAGVNELGRLTAGVFAGLGFEAERVKPANPIHGDHLILTRRGGTDGRSPTIGLVSHLDTVYTADEERSNDFQWQAAGDRLYGPGTVDIKGGTVVLYMVLAALRALFPAAFNGVNWTILLNSAEEDLSPDFGSLCRARLPQDTLACLVFEGGRLSNGRAHLVTARKGRATFHLEVVGRAAHAGASHRKGASAILQLAHSIRDIAALTDYERDLTFNVGTVAGGTVINRVPHLATATGEMRAFTPADFDDGLARLLSLQESVQVQSLEDGYPCQVSIGVLQESAPWPPNDETGRLFDVWQAAAAELGYEAVSEARGGLSDGNYLWDFVPTLDGLGPAGENAHCSERSPDGSKEQEFALASSFIPKAMLNTLAILKLVGYEPADE